MTGKTKVQQIRFQKNLHRELGTSMYRSPNSVNLHPDPVLYTMTQNQENKQLLDFFRQGKESAFLKTATNRSENTSVTIKADQVIVAPEKVTANNNTTKINHTIKSVTKLPKSLKTTLLTSNV